MNVQPILESLEGATRNVCLRIEELTEHYSTTSESVIRICEKTLKELLELQAWVERNCLPKWIDGEGEEVEQSSNELFIRAAKVALENNPDIESRNFFSNMLLRRGGLQNEAKSAGGAPWHPGETLEAAIEREIEEKKKDGLKWGQATGIDVSGITPEEREQIKKRRGDGGAENNFCMNCWKRVPAENLTKRGGGQYCDECVSNMTIGGACGAPEEKKRAKAERKDLCADTPEPAKTPWFMLISTKGIFAVKIERDLGPSEVHHLIADLQAALAKYAPEEVKECPWCTSVSALPHEELHHFTK